MVELLLKDSITEGATVDSDGMQALVWTLASEDPSRKWPARTSVQHPYVKKEGQNILHSLAQLQRRELQKNKKTVVIKRVAKILNAVWTLP